MKRSIFIICVLALFTGNASAAIKQGDYDYDFNFRWSSESPNGSAVGRDNFEVGFGIAKQVTRRIQLGVAVGHNNVEANSSTLVNERSDNWIDLKLRYHIYPDWQWVPYVGGIYRWYERDATTNIIDLTAPPVSTKKRDTATGLLLGVRREITKHNDIYLEFQHLNFGNDWPIGNFDEGNKVLIGLIHQIR